MEKINLHGTELDVAGLCLGTAAYGGELPEEAAVEQLNYYEENGGNFIDTAHIYNDWIPGEKSRSEKVIGRWLKDRNLRNHMLLATKGGHPLFTSIEKSRLNKEDLVNDLEGSLKNLGTDVIDMYILHRDDRQKPVGELLEYLENQVRAGKLRYYGCSNWKAERVKEAREYALAKGLKGFTCNQLMFSLAKVNTEGVADKTLVAMDEATYQYQKESNLSSMAYMSMAKGYFTKKFLNKSLSEELKNMYDNKVNESRYKILKEAFSNSLDVTAYTLQYIQSAPFSSIPIASFSSLSQLKEAIKGCEERISADVMAALKNCEY